MPRGNRARVRRTQRRAAAAGQKMALGGKGVSKARNTQADLAEFGAQGGSFPLGARDETWDGGAAEKSYDLPGDANCYMWFESGADRSNKSSYKFPFVSKNGGKHAVWGAITAAAQRLDGANVPDTDKAGIRGKIETYYAKARSKYDDPSIQVPWKKGEADADAVMFDSDDEFAALAALAGEGRSDREKTKLVLTAAGIIDESDVQTTYDLTNGSVPWRAYYGASIGRSLDAQASAGWPCDAEIGQHGETLAEDGGEFTFLLDAGAVAHVYCGGGWLSVHTAARSRADAVAAIGEFQAAYPPIYAEKPDEDRTVVPITFWMDGRYGPTSRLRMIESATWQDIASNYTADVRAELDRLTADFKPGEGGQLMLWQGPPGTGKTWALRALASEWSDWAEFSYITDPDAFFVHNPSYMIDVLLHESYQSMTVDGDVVDEGQPPESKWRVLILEDTGELLSANAKEQQGQGLSRLLNVVDGMVGQGLRVLVIVTTNDELGDMHPAAVRPGRCASQIAFGPLTADESADWLKARAGGVEAEFEITAEHTLAELYAGLPEAVDAFQDNEPDADDREPMQGQCANCDHMASRHEGEYNDGACMAENCSCQEFDPGEKEPDSDPDDMAADLLAPEPGWVHLSAMTPHMPLIESGTAASSTPNVTVKLQSFTITDANNHVIEIHDPEAFFADQVEIAPPTAMPVGAAVRWEAVLCPEGQATDDGRVFAPGAISWRELPLTLMGLIETGDGHDGAVVCGRIDRIWRDAEAGLIRAAGEFDPGEFGSEIARLVADQTLRGVSVDLAIEKMEVVPRSEVLDPSGKWIGQNAEQEATDEDGPTLVDVLLADDEMVYAILSAVIGAATVCPFQAFRDATIEVAQSLVAAVQSPLVFTVTQDAGFRLAADRSAASTDGVGSLTASAAGIAPAAPPRDWFDDPELDELTPLTVDDDGRVYGHAAAWDTCHIGLPGVCTTAPSSPSDYAYFHLKEVLCDDGQRVSVGTITMETGHADRELGRADAARHYDDTGCAAVDVVVGEDEFGIWVAGAVRPDCDVEEVRKLRGAALSGDWRDVNGNLELVALLAVNVPGFPVPRPRAMVASADDGPHVMTLQSVGIHDGTTTPHETLTEVEAARFAQLLAVAARPE
jgi:ATPase family protein associated with various cellular activities (AAA)